MLGVDPSADPEVIKGAYRALARKFHPDVNSDPKSEAIFKLLSEAYVVIGDPTSRREYDIKYRATKNSSSTHTPPPKTTHQDSPKKTPQKLTIKSVLYNILLFILRLIAPFSGIILVLGGIMLIGWILSLANCSKEGPTPAQPKTGQVPIQTPTLPQAKVDEYADWDAVDLRTGKTPDCFNFKARYNKSIDNKLQIVVGNNADVVIKLINEATNKCIRYVFIRAGDTYSIRHIPEGIYYTKIAYGKDWRQRIINGQCKGKFVESPLYKIGEERLDFNLVQTEEGYQIPSFKLTLDVTYLEDNDKKYSTDNISEDQFNE